MVMLICCDAFCISDVRYDPSRVVSKNAKEVRPKKQISEEKRLHNVIAEHCLPKLVCELHRKSMEEFESFSESEKNLISLIGYVISRFLYRSLRNAIK